MRTKLEVIREREAALAEERAAARQIPASFFEVECPCGACPEWCPQCQQFACEPLMHLPECDWEQSWREQSWC